MGSMPHTETTIECRLRDAGGADPARTIFLDSAPKIINIHDDASGLVAVYRLVRDYRMRALAEYLFDHLA